MQLEAKNILFLGVLSALVLTVLSPALEARVNTKVIYGSDDRVEAREHSDRRLRDMSQAVAGMVAKRHLVAKDNITQLDRLRSLLDPELFERYYDFFDSMAEGQTSNGYAITRNETLAQSQRICADERFAHQKVLPVCTGFLIGPDTLLTAGHCLTTISQCRDYVWVFDYFDTTTQVLKKNVYHCKEVLDQKFGTSLFSVKDYAIIKLDRASERQALELRTSGSVDRGDSVAVIGHPSGLPLKIASNATVKKNYLFTFKTNLDTFAGNSGSPVINVKEGIVEGILVAGAEDYVIDSRRSCQRVARRNEEGQERVFKVTRIKELKDLL